MKKNLQLIVIFCSINSLIGQTFFENKQFGVSMQNPKDWNVAENKDLIKNFENSNFSPEVITKLIKSSKGAILITSFYKYDIDTHSGLIPTIKIIARINSTKSFSEFMDKEKNSAKDLSKFLDNFEYIEEPKEIIISGRKGIKFKTKYSLKTQNGEIMKIKSLNYLILIEKYYLAFNFIDGQEKDDCTEEFEELVKTITIK